MATIPSYESILLGLGPAVEASSEKEVAQGIVAVGKGQPLDAALEPHRDALLRMAWLLQVRVPSLHLSSFATIPMQLETISLSNEGLDGLFSYVRDLEAEAEAPDSEFEGIALLKEAGALCPQIIAASGEALEALARDALTALKRSGQLDAVIEQATSSVMGLVEEGFEQGAFDKLVKRTPRELSETWIERGSKRYAEQDLDGALEAFDEAVAADGTNPRALLCRAELLDFTGDAQAANEDYRVALEEATPDARTFASYGAFLLKHEQLEGAFQMLEKAIALNPDEVSARLNRGIMLRLVNKLDEARADYLRAAELAPKLPMGFVGLGQVALDAGDPDAGAHFTRALELVPEHTEALFGRARARERQGDAVGAAADRAAGAPGLKREGDRLYDLARWRGLAGNLQGAIADYDDALVLNPTDVQALINQGVMHQQLGDQAKALAAWTRAVEVAPDYPNAYVKRGMGLLMAGQADAGVADLKHALSIAPEDWPMRQAILDVIGSG